jgi:predicted NAD/FAD-binding protein
MDANNICVVGSGVAGLTTALLLAKRLKNVGKVTLIESEDRLGGHALTIQANKDVPPVDLGFQVYNLTTYPLLTRLFDELNIETEPSEMSFSCSTERSEWASHGLDSLFATRSNIVSLKFWSMIKEMFRFGKEAKEHLPKLNETMSLQEYLESNKYNESFAQDYLLPMTAAVWSVPVSNVIFIRALVRPYVES